MDDSGQFLKRIDNKPITIENAFPLTKRTFISEEQSKYVQDIIVSRDTENNGMGRKEVVQVIPDIGKADYHFQAENNLYYLVW